MGILNYIFGESDPSYKYHNKYIKCYSCKLEKKIQQDEPYIYKIKGIGKLHNRFICHDCIQEKILKSNLNKINNTYYYNYNVNDNDNYSE